MTPKRPDGKIRADQLVFDRGLAPSRERARALILAGALVADDHRIEKPGELVSVDAELRLKGDPIPYVSRGGLKLAHALDHFGLRERIRGAVCVDVGASTGGFTDCLLQAGAARVHSIDVGYGQLALSLRSDPRVRVLERQNMRHLRPEAVGEAVDLATVDCSFISLVLILPKVAELLKPGGSIVALIKPQFELGPKDIGKGGVVRDPEKHQRAVDKVAAFAREAGWQVHGSTESPHPGPAGNIEFLIWITIPGAPA